MLSKNKIQIKWVKLLESKFHPGILLTKKDSDIICCSIQSSVRYIPVITNDKTYLIKDIIHVKHGVLNKPNVFNHEFLSSKKCDKLLYTKNLIDSGLDRDILDYNKIYFYKGLLKSLFKNDIFLNKEFISQNAEFNNFYERLLFLYQNQELDPRFKELFECVNFFISENFQDLNKEILYHKINVFNYMIDNTDVLNNNILEPFSDNYSKPSLDVQVSLNYLGIKL